MEKSGLNEKHFQKLAEYGLCADSLAGCVCLNYEAGETIVEQGMPIQNLLIVVRGKAKVCAAAQSGKNLVLCYYVSKGILGDVEMMMGMSEADSSIIALTKFECIAVPYCNNAAKLKENICFLNRIAREISAKLIQSSANHVSAALYSGEERLCTYILQTANNHIFNDTLTDVAASVGMSYRHMFRILNQLCSDGILEKKKSGYHIVDQERLRRRGIDT